MMGDRSLGCGTALKRRAQPLARPGVEEDHVSGKFEFPANQADRSRSVLRSGQEGCRLSQTGF